MVIQMIKFSAQLYEKLAYLFFGGLTTVINIAAYFLLAEILRIHYLAANAAAWVLAVLFAYITNRKYVFDAGQKDKKGLLREMAGFFGFRGLSGVLDMAMMYLLVSLMGVNGTASKFIVNVLVVILNYVFSKYFIFKKAA